VQANEKERDIERLVVKRAPRSVIDRGDTDLGKRGSRDRDARGHFEGDEDKQQPIKEVVDPCAYSGAACNPCGGRAYPRSGQNKVDNH